MSAFFCIFQFLVIKCLHFYQKYFFKILLQQNLHTLVAVISFQFIVFKLNCQVILQSEVKEHKRKWKTTTKYCNPYSYNIQKTTILFFDCSSFFFICFDRSTRSAILHNYTSTLSGVSGRRHLKTTKILTSQWPALTNQIHSHSQGRISPANRVTWTRP